MGVSNPPMGGGGGGSSGQDGLSAYQLAQQQGFSGTLTEWLDSLQGADGIDGQPGADGQDGSQGIPGSDGADGQQGVPGNDGEDGAPGPNIVPFTFPGDLSVGRKTSPYVVVGNRTLSRVICAIDSAATGDDVGVAIERNGTLVRYAELTSGQISSSVSSLSHGFTDGDVVQLEVTGIGSTLAGSGLTVLLVF